MTCHNPSCAIRLFPLILQPCVLCAVVVRNKIYVIEASTDSLDHDLIEGISSAFSLSIRMSYHQDTKFTLVFIWVMALFGALDYDLSYSLVRDQVIPFDSSALCSLCGSGEKQTTFMCGENLYHHTISVFLPNVVHDSFYRQKETLILKRRSGFFI